MDAKKTIFVVDDNYELVEMVRFILEGAGFEAIGLYSGSKLFKRLEMQKPEPHFFGYYDAADGWLRDLRTT